MSTRDWWLGVAAVLAVAAMAGVGDAAATATTKQPASPCRTMGSSVVAWSPSEKRIAFVGHGVRSAALCVADAGGRDARPLRNATCPRRSYCKLINDPTELSWVRPRSLLYGDSTKGIFAVPLAGKPKRIASLSDVYDEFSVDAAGDRIAHGSSSCCSESHGPVVVLSVPGGRVVGKIGETKTANFSPSLSPDGKQVAFEGGQPQGIWAASIAGSNLRRLQQCDSDPIWSPTGKWIARLGPPHAWPSGSALLLVSPQDDASVTVARPSLGVTKIFGWSANGLRIAFRAQTSDSGSRLDVVNLATDKVRTLRSPAGDSVAWAPDSRRLLVSHDCRLWRVAVVGTQKPRRLRSGAPGGSCSG